MVGGQEGQRLSVEAGQLNNRPEAFARLEVEHDDLVPGDTVEVPVRSDSEATWFPELGQSTWRKHTDEIALRGIVFPNGGRGVGRAEGILARYQNVAVGRNGQIERTEIGIFDAPTR